jgi:hypothetical protein
VCWSCSTACCQLARCPTILTLALCCCVLLCAARLGVLELLNCLLSAGEVPGLFGPDELAKDMAALEAKRTADTHYQVRHLFGQSLLLMGCDMRQFLDMINSVRPPVLGCSRCRCCDVAALEAKRAADSHYQVRQPLTMNSVLPVLLVCCVVGHWRARGRQTATTRRDALSAALRNQGC